MLIAPTAVMALLLLTGLYRAVRRWRRRRTAARIAARLIEAQQQRDIEALTAGAHHRAPAVCVLAEAHRILDRALAMYGPSPRPDLKGDGDEQP